MTTTLDLAAPWLLAFLASALCAAPAQDAAPAQPAGVNMDFETAGGTPGALAGWLQPGVSPPTGTRGYEASRAVDVAHSGSGSARLRSDGTPRTSGFGTVTQMIAADAWRGKRVRLSGHVRTEHVVGGAGLWMRVDARWGTAAMDTMQARALYGDHDWTRCEVVEDVDSEADALVFGVRLAGQGTIWVDDLRLEAVGTDVPVTTMVFGSHPPPPPPETVDWLRTHAVPLSTVEAGNGLQDLEPLRAMIGDARVVALGEGTHGTREFFQLKHRLLEFLATEMGFTVFAIEANMPEAQRADAYVLGGAGTPEALLDGMYFWTWNTAEVRDMLRWMRAFNASGKGPLHFTGFDMQMPDVAMSNVRDFVSRTEPDYLETLDEAWVPMRDLMGGIGRLVASFPIEQAAGHHVRLSGAIRTQDAGKGWAGLWWRADGPDGSVLTSENMQASGPRGTTDWKRYAIDLDVPAATTRIEFGIVCPGVGASWFDDLRIEIDGAPWSSPDLDLGLDSATPRGFVADAAGGHFRDDAPSRLSGNDVAGDRSLHYDHAEATADPAEAVRFAGAVVRHMEGRRAPSGAAGTADELDWAVQDARVVQQCAEMMAGKVSRDASMAANVRWLLDHSPPGTRIVLWAHNGHVNRVPDVMGGELAKTLGKQMVVIGFSTNAGEYTAVSDGHLQANPLKAPPSGSLEAALHATGLPRLLIDLRPAASTDPASRWLTYELPFRDIGALRGDRQFSNLPVQEAFDVIAFVDQTTATRLLHQ